MEHDLRDDDEWGGIEPLVILGDLARKYNVRELIAQLDREIGQLLNYFQDWTEEFMELIDSVFELVGDSDTWRVLEDVLVPWTCEQELHDKQVEQEDFDEFLSRHERLAVRIARNLWYKEV
jgi:hypothetical protein